MKAKICITIIIAIISTVSFAEEKSKFNIKKLEPDYVLKNLENGIDNLRQTKSNEAEENFDNALDVIERFFITNDSIKKIRSLRGIEENKVFKGEPYERSYAYFFRAYLYLINGDLDNASASLNNMVLHDAVAEEEQYRSDLKTPIYLLKWIELIKGNKISRYDSEFKELYPEESMDIGRNLIIVDVGYGPRKLKDGLDESALVYRKNRNNREVDFFLGGKKCINREDIYYQAVTRGGREFDKILKGKLQYKNTINESANVVSDIATVTTSALSATPGIGLVAAAASGLVTGFSRAEAKKINTQADSRHWRNLPEYIYICDSGNRKDINLVSKIDGKFNKNYKPKYINIKDGYNISYVRVENEE